MLTNEHLCVKIKITSLRRVATMDTQTNTQANTQETIRTKFCKHCGSKIPEDAVICTACGRQVEELKSASASTPNIVINNANTNTNTNINSTPTYRGKEKNKWVALFLCIFLGLWGGHKFYEGKFLTGILYMCTGGLFLVGVIIDLIALIFKPNPYYVL